MSLGDYCSLAELKAELWPHGTTPDDQDDTVLENIVGAVSRWIDAFTRTRFYTTVSDETRYFSPPANNIVFVDDLLTVTSLATDEDGARTYLTAWATTDYDLLPENASAHFEPYRWIEPTPEGDFYFPIGRKTVRIVGKFGYCQTAAIPDPVRRACLLQSVRMFKRKDAPFGLISNPVGGAVRLLSQVDPDDRLLSQVDPDVRALLMEYRRLI